MGSGSLGSATVAGRSQMGNLGKKMAGHPEPRSPWHPAGALGEAGRERQRWVSGADLLLGCLVLVKSFDRTAYFCRKLNVQFFPREMFQLVFFNFLIFGSWRLRALNAMVEAFAYRYDLQPIHSCSSVLSLNVQIRFEI